MWAGGQFGPITCVPCKHKDFVSNPMSGGGGRQRPEEPWDWLASQPMNAGNSRPVRDPVVGWFACFLMSGTAAEQ